MHWKDAWINSRDDAELFVRHVLKAEPNPWQAEGLDLISKYDRLAIRAGHDVGKTAFEAWVSIWFILTRVPAIIPITANSKDQLRDVTWAETQRWCRKLPDDLRERLEIGQERIMLKDAPDQAYMVARTASKDKPEALQGFHSPNLLYVIEEASGIDDIVFEVARGALASKGAKVVMCGNPTRRSGYFYNAFNANREHWTCMHVPWRADNPWTNPKYGADVADEYGEQSNVYRVRVLGEFPISEDDAVVPLELVEAAVNRDVVMKDNHSMIWGVDVGRGGDPSAILKRQGNHIVGNPIVIKSPNTMTVVGRILREWRETPIHKRPASINVDVIGIGAGVLDRLQELGLPAFAVNVGETISLNDPTRFGRLRDELWWAVRDWFDAKDCRIPDDPLLISEITAPTYKELSSGKISVESKDDMKGRGIKSPNCADALCLTFAGGEFSSLAKRQRFADDQYDPTDQDRLHRRADNDTYQTHAIMGEREG